MKLLCKIFMGTLGFVAVFGGSLAIVTYGATNFSSNPYIPTTYSYTKPFIIKSSDGLRDLEVNLDTFRAALKSYGVSKSNPMSIDYITPMSALGPLNTAMYNQIGIEINKTLSDELIKFSWLLSTNSNPSSRSWFTQGNSEMGFYLWSPDYDGVGTWISAWIQMDKDGNNISNAINAWKLIHERMINVLCKKDDYVAIYGENYYNAAKDLLNNLKTYGLYKNIYSYDKPFEIPIDYKQAFKDVGTENSQTLNMDYFISQILSGKSGLNIANFMIQVLDSNYIVMPMPGIGLNYRDPQLMDPQFIPRDSPFMSVQIRDYGVKSASTYVPMNNSQYGLFKSITSVDFFTLSQQLFNQQFGTAQPYLNSNDVGQVSLVGMETTGGWKNDDLISKPIDHLRLNGSTQLKLYDITGNLLQILSRNKDIDMNDQTISNSLQKAVKYEFTIDKNMGWVDNSGIQKQALSGKDFERGFEAFWLASAIGLNKNSYFINSMNLDMNKTVNNTDKKINSVEYDINDFTNSDDIFTVHVKQPNIYLLQYLSKGYFWALPNTNNKVKSIKYGTSNIVNNPTNINWNNIYGDGTKANDIMDGNFWSAAPYYLSNLSSSEMILKYNDVYFNARKNDLLNTDEKIQQYVIKSIPGINAANLYEQFLAGNASAAQIPVDYSISVLTNPSMQNQILYSGVGKTIQSNYAIWNGNPYDKKEELKSTISPMTAKFLSNPQSDNAIIIRAGIAGFINWYNISQMVYNSGDFTYSIIPYGVFDWDVIDSNTRNKIQHELYREIYNGSYAPFSVTSNGILPRSVMEYIYAGLGV